MKDKATKEKETTPPIDLNVPITSESLRHLIKDTVIKLGATLSKEQKVEQAKVLTKIFENGLTPKDAMKISDEELSQLYSYAYYLFTAGKYLEARELFKMLLIIEPREPGFATSLGACHHHLKDYGMALDAYMLACNMTPEDPVPLFYAYDCFLKLNNPTAAAIMLSNVIATAGDNPKYAKAKQRATLLLDGLETKIIMSTNSE